MAARTVSVKLVAEVGNYVTGMKNAAKATKDLTSDTLTAANKNKQAWNEVGTTLAAFGAAAAVGVGLAVKRFADFDQAMSNVQAATHESAAAMGDLREAALDAGAKTAFSATEAAGAIEELAKAGVSTQDILGGGLAGALDLAAAGSLEVGEAAEIAATALVQFGLDGARVPHVADLLAAAAGKAQGSVGDMGAALKQVGLIANSTGLTVEETTAGLAAFASAGLIGSDAGTSFKSMLQRLNPQSEEAAALMDKLGFSAYDSQGNFIGLEALAGELTDSFAGMTDEQRNAASATLFGSDAVRAATVLYDQGAAGIADWTAKVNDQGYAAETAAIKLDNLNGDLEALGGSFETALIGSGSAANGVLREMTQAATGVLNAYSNMPGPIQGAVTGLAGIAGVAGTVAGGFLLLAPRIASTRDALATLSETSPRVTGAMAAVGKSLGALAVVGAVATGFAALARAFDEAAPSVDQMTAALVNLSGGSAGAFVKTFGSDLDALGESVRRLTDKSNQEKFLDWGQAVFTAGQRAGDDKFVEAKARLDAVDASLANLVSSGHPEDAKAAFDRLAEGAKKSGASTEELKRVLPGYADALTRQTTQSKLADGATDGLTDSQKSLDGAVMSATGEIKSETEALVDNMAKVRDATGLVLGLRDANRGYEEALDTATAALAENGRTLDTTTDSGRKNEAALDAIASSANDVLESMIATGTPLDQVSAKLGTQRDALIKAAEKFGMTEDAARAYAESVLRIPDKRTTAVATPGLSQSKAAVEAFTRSVAAIPSFKRVVVRYDEVLGTTVQKGNYPGRNVERASGGWVFGPGTATSDSIPARLSNGEFVVNARSAAQNRALLEAINGNRFATGGWVGGQAAPQPGGIATAAADISALAEGVQALGEELRSINATVAALPRQHQKNQRQGGAT